MPSEIPNSSYSTALDLYRTAINAGASPTNASYLVGSAYQESGFNPRLTGDDHGTSSGLMQVGNPFYNSMVSHGQTSATAQMAAYIAQLRSNAPATWAAMNRAGSPEAAYAAQHANRDWRMGIPGDRFKYAKQVANMPPGSGTALPPQQSFNPSNSAYNWAQNYNPTSPSAPAYNAPSYQGQALLAEGGTSIPTGPRAANYDELMAGSALVDSGERVPTSAAPYSPLIPGFLGNTPIGSVINGLAATATGHFMDGTRAGRLLTSAGHVINGTLGQHGNDNQPASGASGALPTLQFDSSGRILNGLPGGTGTVAGRDPRTGQLIMNATPAGDYVPRTGGGYNQGGYGAGYGQGAGLRWDSTTGRYVSGDHGAQTYQQGLASGRYGSDGQNYGQSRSEENAQLMASVAMHDPTNYSRPDQIGYTGDDPLGGAHGVRSLAHNNGLSGTQLAANDAAQAADQGRLWALYSSPNANGGSFGVNGGFGGQSAPPAPPPIFASGPPVASLPPIPPALLGYA